MVKIYVEGGGSRKDLRTECRKGFSELIRRAGFEGRMPKFVAKGSRSEAFNAFCTAVQGANDSDFIILLVDSEAPVKDINKPWQHLHDRIGDGWKKPKGAKNDNAHLMVQVMESWFYADRDALAKYYGNGFKVKALSSNDKIEAIPKDDIFEGLKKATKGTTKGEYDKGEDSFKILECLDPEKLIKSLPSAKRLFNTLQSVTDSK